MAEYEGYTVGELVKELNKYPKNMKVLVDGYEGGLADIDSICNGEVRLNWHGNWYYGAHEGYGAVKDHPNADKGIVEEIVLISRDSGHDNEKNMV